MYDPACTRIVTPVVASGTGPPGLASRVRAGGSGAPLWLAALCLASTTMAGVVRAAPDKSADAATAPSEAGARDTLVTTGALSVRPKSVWPMGKPLGIGLEFGPTTSLSVRARLSEAEALTFAVGALGGPFSAGALSLAGDYTWHPHVLLRSESVSLSWFVGGGAWLALGPTPGAFPVGGSWVWATSLALAARVPLGVQATLSHLPIDLFVRADPALFVVPRLAPFMSGSVGARLYF